MKRKWLIIPEYEQREAFAALAEQYQAAFEYNDFYLPAVYEKEEEINRRIKGYCELNRDRSKDMLHGAFLDVVASSEDAVIAEYSKKRMRHSMEIAKRLGIRGVVFHSGLVRGVTGSQYLENWVERQSSFIRELLEEFPELEICMENTQEETPEQLLRLKERLRDCQRFSLCLDYAHANISGTKPESWVKQMGQQIGHFHINDNDGRLDLHQVPGEGSIDWSSFEAVTKELEQVSVLIEINGLEKQKRALEYLKQLDERGKHMNGGRINLMDILDIGIQMAKEKDGNHLLSMILNRCMEYTGCDAGTLYLFENNALTFKLMKTNSLNINRGEAGEIINLPPVPMKEENICAYAAIHKKVLNIHDVERSSMFDFSGPKRYDEMTGYCTKSMLVVPMNSHEDRLIGVLQLINAQDEDGVVVNFAKEIEPVIYSLASQAAIVLENLLYTEEIKQQMWSFTEALAEAVDARTPYNGSHIRKVAEYAGKIADHINLLHEQGMEQDYFDFRRKEQLIMGALLHDIGKIIVPLEVMNKIKRLDGKEEVVLARLDLISAYYQIDCLNGCLSAEEEAQKQQELNEVRRVIQDVNGVWIVSEEQKERLEKILSLTYEERGIRLPYFTEEEKECLRVERGTLTNGEREVMESHVALTERILSKVHFYSYYADSPVWAATHHEMLDGSGYPRGLKGEELALESRIMAVADICDALLASDRPYKKPLPKEEAFRVMEGMAEEGKLEKRLVKYLEACI